MVTLDYKKRFTAVEALQFFEDMYSLLTQEQLQASPPNCSINIDYCIFNRWRDLPPELVQRWTSYREPPMPMVDQSAALHMRLSSDSSCHRLCSTNVESTYGPCVALRFDHYQISSKAWISYALPSGII